MDQAALSVLLDELVATWENEVVEFKQANNDYKTDTIDEYFSALANEANLRGMVAGSVVDLAYSRLLIQKTDVPLAGVLALDRVQKKLPIPESAVARLKRSGLIEGRKPHFHVSAAVAGMTAGKVDYIHTRAQDDEFYAKLLTDYLSKFGQATRQEVNQLLLPKLSDTFLCKQSSTMFLQRSCREETTLCSPKPLPCSTREFVALADSTNAGKR